MEKEKVTLSIDKQIMKEVRLYCVEHNNIEYSSFVEQLMREKLHKKK
ncbi:hypothetical protein J4205_03425 [Candidatus Pacearchaeota archaeon]|nr:hypothetical protein [Candidatus Pacearchaeota archaeon]